MKPCVRKGGWLRFLAWWTILVAPGLVGAERELVRDRHFQRGFCLLEPAPGKRVVYGKLPGVEPGEPAWDLAQWSSKFPLQSAGCLRSNGGIICSNSAKRVCAGRVNGTEADLALGVNTGTEYPEARKSTAEPWVHLLVQQEFPDAPELGSLSELNFHCEARLTRSQLLRKNSYSPAIHAAQFLVYLTVANRNPKAPGYQECFWFGIPIYDNREQFVSDYEAQDFGDTKLFIFTPGAKTFCRDSTHSREWVAFERDLLPLMRQGLEHARAKGFIRGSTDLADYRPMGVFIGWEVPGVFDVELQIRSLSLKAKERPKRPDAKSEGSRKS